MGKVQLQPLEASGQRAAGSGHKVGLHTFDIGQGHLAGHAAQVAAKGDGRRRNGLPGAWVALGDMVVALPRAVGAGLAACVCNLDAGHSACGLDAGGNAGQSWHMGVIPQAQARGADAAIGRDAGGFDNHQASAASGDRWVVHLVPVIRKAIGGAVLAHRGHGNAVAQGDVFEGKGGKQG